jgi:glycosyltransferase involved in cell wall biosynthesis
MFHLQPYDQMFHVGRQELARIINSFDCLVAPSTNEGFGVPIIEAQACGKPVIVNNFTAMPELVIEGETGLICDVGYKRFSPLGSFIANPDVNSLHNCMVEIFRKDRKKMGIKAREHVVKNYDSETIFNTQWKPFLQRLEHEVYPEPSLTS